MIAASELVDSVATAKEPAGEPTLDELRTALQAHAANKGRDSALMVLAAHGAANASSLPETKYAAVITELAA